MVFWIKLKNQGGQVVGCDVLKVLSSSWCLKVWFFGSYWVFQWSPLKVSYPRGIHSWYWDILGADDFHSYQVLRSIVYCWNCEWFACASWQLGHVTVVFSCHVCFEHVSVQGFLMFSVTIHLICFQNFTDLRSKFIINHRKCNLNRQHGMKIEKNHHHFCALQLFHGTKPHPWPFEQLFRPEPRRRWRRLEVATRFLINGWTAPSFPLNWLLDIAICDILIPLSWHQSTNVISDHPLLSRFIPKKTHVIIMFFVLNRSKVTSIYHVF